MSLRPGGLRSEIQESHSSTMKSGANKKGCEVMKLGEEHSEWERGLEGAEVDSGGGYDQICYIHG